jgi:hypothetical protein
MPPQTIVGTLVLFRKAAASHPSGDEFQAEPWKGVVAASDENLLSHYHFLDDPGTFELVLTKERRQV